MSSKPKISLSAATGLLEAIAAAGGNPDRMLGVIGLHRSGLANPDDYIESATFARILELAAIETANSCFGLHFGEHFDPRDLGALGYVVLNSASVAIALHNIERYLHIHNEAARVTFSVDGQHAYLRFLLAGLQNESARQHIEYSMALALKALRILAGSNWHPSEVRFAIQAPQDSSEHQRVFGCRIVFGSTANEFVFDGRKLEQPVMGADAKLYRILKRQAERLLSEMPRETGPVLPVRQAIVEAMQEGAPTLTHVAKAMSMSPRTLERRLKEHGLVFKTLLDDTRRRFALDYLKTRKRSLTEIAYLLGYSEASAFNRAFKRWTNSTPAQYRSRHRH
jgi:AraC-like DNA-binding protein